ncbi:MAG: hypothetical protein ACXQT2_01505 [Methanotrichaceae archaeon]
MSEAIPQDIDPDRIDGLNAPSAVAFVIGKDAEDLQEIEDIPGARAAFHRANGDGGYYFVDTDSGRCTCPSFRFSTGLVEGQCKHLRAVARKQSIAERNAQRAAKGQDPQSRRV